MAKIKSFEKEDKIKNLGDKVCRLANYYEKGKGRNLELAALADVLFSIKEIFKSHDRRFERLEKRLKEKEKAVAID